MGDNVKAQVGEYSRESGRGPVSVSVKRLQDERDSLVTEKQKLEAALADVEWEKRSALTMVYRRGLTKSAACAETNAIESKYQKDRSSLIRNKVAIEERLNDLKNRLISARSSEPREDVAVLLRIEALLLQILGKLP